MLLSSSVIPWSFFLSWRSLLNFTFGLDKNDLDTLSVWRALGVQGSILVAVIAFTSPGSRPMIMVSSARGAAAGVVVFDL
jgi:hypothetical protein